MEHGLVLGGETIFISSRSEYINVDRRPIQDDYSNDFGGKMSPNSLSFSKYKTDWLSLQCINRWLSLQCVNRLAIVTMHTNPSLVTFEFTFF